MSIAIHLSEFWKGYFTCMVAGIVIEVVMSIWRGPRGKQVK